MKKAFTIIELLVVIAVIGVLVTIVVVAAQGALKSARAKRADSMCLVLEQAIEAFRAQDPGGKWPSALETKLSSIDTDTYTLSANETDGVFQEVVKKGFGKAGGRQSVLVDASALYVCDKSNCGNGNAGCNDNHGDREQASFCGNKRCRPGLDFSEAVKRGSSRHLSIDQMAFGYQGPEYGKFCRFKIIYNSRTDSVKVTR